MLRRARSFSRTPCPNPLPLPPPLHASTLPTYSCRFIDAALEKGEHVLVCCHSGLGKSASVILYYVMKKEGVSFADAHRRVEEQRHGVRDMCHAACAMT